MAIALGDRNEVIKVISSKDDAVTCSLDEYKDYLESLDTSLLGLKEGVEPTVFHLKRILTAEEENFVESKKLGSSKDGTPQVQLSFIPEAVRQALVKIEPAVEDRQHPKTGKFSAEFISVLNQIGVASELYAARENALNGTTGGAGLMKKK